MEEIILDLNELDAFNNFLKSPGVVVLEKTIKEDKEIIICNTNQKFIIPKNNISNDSDLIYGKDPTMGVTSVEVSGDQLVIFKQTENGTTEIEYRKNQLWYVTPKPMEKSAKKLEGNLFYKWINYIDSEEEYDQKQFFKIDCYRPYDKKEMALIKSGITYFKGLKHDQVNILSFDIETNGVSLDSQSKVLLIANTYRDSKGKVQKKLFSYDEYENDKEFINSWCSWVRKNDPSIICGHNIYGFDFPFLEHFAELNGTQLNLGRDNSPIKFNQRESKFRKDGSQFIHYKKCFIFGREIIDTMFLAIKYDVSRNLENYRLKSIINQLGLEKENRQFYDASKIKDNYLDKQEFEKIKQYASDDGDDSLALYDLMVPAFFYMSQSIPKSFQSIIESASGSQINALLCRSYMAANHSIPKASETVDFQGAISLGNPGIYKNAFKVDVASLYPSIMREYKVYDQYKDPKANFLKLTEFFTLERLKNKKKHKETKDKYFDDLQSSQKILINSMYGFMGASGLNFNSPSKAAFITTKGREILEKTILFSTNQDLQYWKDVCDRKDKGS